MLQDKPFIVTIIILTLSLILNWAQSQMGDLDDFLDCCRVTFVIVLILAIGIFTFIGIGTVITLLGS